MELLAAVEGVPAYVWGRRTDVLAWNNTASAHAEPGSEPVEGSRLLASWGADASRDFTTVARD
ncbi:MmyB family transcriptional regulator [Crossiella sp. NPDC003009]